MSIIDQLKAEIERLKKQLVRGACAAQIQMETSCKEEAYNEVLSFLATLEENPVDLEIEIVKYQEEYFEYNSEYDTITLKGKFLPSPQTLENIARHFFALGQQSNPNPQRKLRKVSTWVSDTERELELDEEITDFIANHYTVDAYDGLTYHGEYLDTDNVKAIARHFYNLGKNHFREPTKMVEKSEIPTNLYEAGADKSEEYYPIEHNMSDEEKEMYAGKQVAFQVGFKAGAMWDREQGVSMEGVVSRKYDHQYHGFPSILVCDVPAMVNQLIPQDTEAKVIVQIRKKDE